MSVPRTAIPFADPHLLAIVEAARRCEVEFCDWCLESPPGAPTMIGHIQVADRRGVTRVVDALLDLDARIDLDIAPSTVDAEGCWSVWIRAQPRSTDPPGYA
jgi:hypothetical protein